MTYLIVKIIILLHNIIKFFNLKYWRFFIKCLNIFISFLRISHEFRAYDLDQSLFFIFYSVISCQNYSTSTVKYATHSLWFSNVIDIPQDRFLSGKNGGKKHASSVKNKVLSRWIVQNEISSRSSQIKIEINNCQICVCVLNFLDKTCIFGFNSK